MRHRAWLIACAGLFITVGVAACGGSNNPAAPTTPAAVLATETFTGTISPLGTAFNSFTVNYAGSNSDASITVTSLTTVASGTPQAITIGIGFGTVNLGVCTRSASYTNPAAPLNTELTTTGMPFSAGSFCVQVFDNTSAPTVTEPLNYSITVKHY